MRLWNASWGQKPAWQVGESQTRDKYQKAWDLRPSYLAAFGLGRSQQRLMMGDGRAMVCEGARAAAA